MPCSSINFSRAIAAGEFSLIGVIAGSPVRAVGAFRRAVAAAPAPIHRPHPKRRRATERLIGTLRRDCLDHVLIFGARHLRRILGSYSCYYPIARITLRPSNGMPLRALSRYNNAGLVRTDRIAF